LKTYFEYSSTMSCSSTGAEHFGGERVVVGLQPGRHSGRELGRVADHVRGPARRLDRDHVVRLHLIAGDVDAAAVHRPVAMADQLPGLAA